MNSFSIKTKILSALGLIMILSLLITWFFIKPSYETAILDEREIMVSQYHSKTVNALANSFKYWVNIIGDVAETIETKPENLENLVQTYIKMFPDLIFFKVKDVQTGEFIEVRQSNSFIESIPNSWKNSLNTTTFSSDLEFDLIKDENTYVLYFCYQVDINERAYQFDLVFNMINQIDLLAEIPINNSKSILFDSNKIYFSSDTIKVELDIAESTLQRILSVSQGDKHWLVTAQELPILPLTLAVLVSEEEVIAPVKNLFQTTLIILSITFIILIIIGWFLSDLIQKPIKQLQTDISPFVEFNFSKTIRTSTLPEFNTISLALEEIRKKLEDYQKRNIEQQLIEQERNKLLMNHSSELVALVDSNLDITYINQRFHILLREIDVQLPISWNELESHTKISIDKEEVIDFKQEDSRVQVKQARWTVKTIKNQLYYFNMHRVDLVVDSNPGSMIILSDITRERDLDIKRNEMISVIVHELRNPVAGIMGLTQLLQMHHVEKETQEEYFQHILNNANEMNNLINRFLTISRLEANSAIIEKEPIEIESTLKNIVSTFISQLQDNRLTIKTNVQQEVGVIVASQTLFVDALKNLISNAIKYGEHYREIEVDVIEEDEFCKISVTDHGFGIAPEHQSKVFEKFYRIKAHKGIVGTGLGLPYVKEIMERHDGKITLESNDKIGTRISLWFPLNAEI